MGKALSVDLRDRAVAAVAGGLSRRKAAERFGVRMSSAIRWTALCLSRSRWRMSCWRYPPLYHCGRDHRRCRRHRRTPRRRRRAATAGPAADAASISDITLTETVNGAQTMQEFATAAAATKYLTDYALNLGRFSGALATVPVDVHVQIEITATTSDAAFGVSFLLGNGSGSGATHPLFSSQIVG